MSPKNKGKFGKGKPAVELTDEFVETVATFSDRLKPHAVKIAVVLGGFLFAIAAWGSYRWYNERKDQKATIDFVRALDAARADIVAQTEDTPPDGDPNKPVTYPSREARSQATLIALDNLKGDHGDRKATGQADLLRAQTLAELGRYDDAIAAFDRFAKNTPTNDLRRLAYLGTGYAYEAKGQATEDAAAKGAAFEQALESFRKIANQPGESAQVESLYHEGRLLSMLDRRDEALEKLRKARELGRQSYLVVDIDERIAIIEATAAK